MSERKKVAISGTIGSGKSTVCAYLRSKGYDVFDCDKVNRELLEKGNKGFEKVEEYFPEVIIDGKLNKKKLAEIIFNNHEKKELLESLLHPLILEELFKRDDNPLFAEVPLLFEVNWDRYFDINVLVVSDDDIVIDRLIERGMEIEDIKARMKAQMSVQEKSKRADKIIYNNGSLKDLEKEVDELLREIIW